MHEQRDLLIVVQGEGRTADVHRHGGLVWPSGTGTPLSPSNLRRLLRRQCELAGIRQVTFHTLRHYAATLLLAQGVPSVVILDVLGHQDVQDAAPVPARDQLAAPRRRRRDGPQLSCQSSCQRRSPRARTGGYVGWGVQESNLAWTISTSANGCHCIPLTCGNATLPFRPEAACAPCSPSVRCQAVATSALSGPSYSASGSLARTRSGWRARAWASCSLAALVSASVGWKNTGPWEAAKMARS